MRPSLVRLADCPPLADLPPWARADMRIAYLEGDRAKALRIMARPIRTCLICESPQHSQQKCAPPPLPFFLGAAAPCTLWSPGLALERHEGRPPLLLCPSV
jgi:hypothetical protein